MISRRQRHLSFAGCGCQLVLDARQMGAQADNTTVQTWPAARGTTITADQAAPGSRPLYLQSTINGQPGVVFDGTDDMMNLSAGALALSGNVTSVFMIAVAVVTSAATDVLQYVLFNSKGDSASGNRFSYRAVDTSVARATMSVRRADNDTNVVTTSGGVTTSPHVAVGVNDYVGDLASISMNGATPVTVAFSSGGGPGTGTPSVASAIGGLSTIANRLNGKIGLVAVMAAAPSAALRTRMRVAAGLSWKIATF